jgi:hypothetical protein
VELTEQGRRRIRIAIRGMIESGGVQLAVDSAIAGSRGPLGRDWYDGMACLHGCEMLDSYLTRIRRAYGDIATLYYRWHPDD